MDQQATMFFAMWHMRCEILRHSTKESCILSTKLLCELLRKLDIKAMPLVVDVIAANEIAFQKNLRGEDYDPEDPNDPAFAMRCRVVPGGGDPDSNDNVWQAHIGVLADGRFFLDPSADQFTRTEHGIIAKPSMFAFEDADRLEAWLHGDMERASVHLPDGGTLNYEAHLEETSYLESPDWIDSEPGDGLYESVMAKVHGLLGIYEDADDLPDLPDLPPGRSMKDPKTVETLAQSLRSAHELGYSIEDLRQREAAEEERSAERRKRKAEELAADVLR